MIVDLIVLFIIVLAVGAALAYIKKERKRGIKCIGCPYAESCGKKDSCGGHTDIKQNTN